jgi:PAS domain S-box-containing protein
MSDTCHSILMLLYIVRDAVAANFAIMYFSNGTLAAYVGYDLPTGNVIQLPQELQFLDAGHPLLKDMNKATARVNGFLLTKSVGTLLLSAYPIHYSPIKETPSGILIFARIKTEVITRSIAARAQMCVAMYELNDKSVSQNLPSTKSVKPTIINGYDQYWSNNQVFRIQSIDTSNAKIRQGRVCYRAQEETSGKERMATFQLYADIFGEPALILRADVPRYIHKLGMNSFLLAFWLVVFILIVLGAVIVLFTEINILRLIVTVTKGVTEIVRSNDISKRINISGSDEISKLGSRVNRLLSMIESSQEQLTQKQKEMQVLLQKISSEESRSRTIMNSISDFIVTIDRETGIVLNVNNVFYDKLDYTAQEIEGLSVHSSKIFRDYSDKELLEHYLKLHEEERSMDISVYTQSGTSIPCRISAKPAKMYQDEKVIDAFVVSIHDLSSELKLIAELQSDEEKMKQIQLEIDFDGMMKNPAQIQDFKQWLSEHHPIVTSKIEFLEQIRLYRSIGQTHSRFNKQQEIINQYLSTEATNPIVISHKHMDRIMHDLRTGTGQYDLFDQIEAIVKSSVVSENFKTYCFTPDKE